MTELLTAAKELEQAENDYIAAVKQRTAAIDIALGMGIKPAEIARILGVSRARIAQLTKKPDTISLDD